MRCESTSVVSRCTIVSNRAYWGAGVYFRPGAVATGSTFTVNTATNGGGAALCDAGGRLTGCTLISNTAWWGGAVHCYNGGVVEGGAGGVAFGTDIRASSGRV